PRQREIARSLSRLSSCAPYCQRLLGHRVLRIVLADTVGDACGPDRVEESIASRSSSSHLGLTGPTPVRTRAVLAACRAAARAAAGCMVGSAALVSTPVFGPADPTPFDVVPVPAVVFAGAPAFSRGKLPVIRTLVSPLAP